MTGGHDAQPCRILEAIGKKAKVRQKLSDWDLDCGDNIQLKENLGDFSHLSWKRTSVYESTNSVLEKTQNSMFKVVRASSSIRTRTNRPERPSKKESSSSEDDDETDDDAETLCLEKSLKKQISSIHTRTNRPQRQSTKESSSSEDDDETDNDAETPMCLENSKHIGENTLSVEKQMCIEKAQFPFSCAMSDIKYRSSFKDFDWSSDEDCPLKYILPTKYKIFGKTARKSISTANSIREVIFRGSQDTSSNKTINHRSPSVKTKCKISRGELLTKSMLQSYPKGSSHESSPHKKSVGKLVISRQNNRYTAFPVVPSSSKKLETETGKFRIENFIKKY